MRTWLLCCILLLPALAAAEVGDLTHVACETPKGPEALAISWVSFESANLKKPPRSATGLVHADALVGMVKVTDAVSVSVAIDGEARDAKVLDVLRLDFTGAGAFQDAARIKLKLSTSTTELSGEIHASRIELKLSTSMFGPLAVKIRWNGVERPVMVTGIYHSFAAGNRRRKNTGCVSLIVHMATQGTCRFGEKTHAVRLFDQDRSYVCGGRPKRHRLMRSARSYPMGDTVLIDFGDGSFGAGAEEFYCWQPLFVDGKWYRLKVSDDGAKVRAEPIAVKTGRIECSATKWSAVLSGKGGFLRIVGDAAGAVAPVGGYSAIEAREWSAPDAKGRRGVIVYQYSTAAVQKGLIIPAPDAKVRRGMIVPLIETAADHRRGQGGGPQGQPTACRRGHQHAVQPSRPQVGPDEHEVHQPGRHQGVEHPAAQRRAPRSPEARSGRRVGPNGLPGHVGVWVRLHLLAHVECAEEPDRNLHRQDDLRHRAVPDDDPGREDRYPVRPA